MAATDTVPLNRQENEPLKQVKEMEKLERGGLADAVIDDNTEITFMRWKDNKVVNVISSTYWVKSYCKNKTES